jgi:hypothetical protein
VYDENGVIDKGGCQVRVIDRGGVKYKGREVYISLRPIVHLSQPPIEEVGCQSILAWQKNF